MAEVPVYLVRVLLSDGADPEIRNRRGDRPYQWFGWPRMHPAARFVRGKQVRYRSTARVRVGLRPPKKTDIYYGSKQIVAFKLFRCKKQNKYPNTFFHSFLSFLV